MKSLFLTFAVPVGLIVLATSCATRDATMHTQRSEQPTSVARNPDDVSDPKAAVQRVIAQKDRYISKYTGLGKSLVSLGQPAIDELTQALDNAAPADRGYIANALGLFGTEAKSAVPMLIETFPLEPNGKISVKLDQKPTSDEEIAALIIKFGEGSLVQQQVGNKPIPTNPDGTLNLTSADFGPVSYFYSFQAPAAVVALQKITGAYAGIQQEDWQQWLKAQATK